jgi:lysophospholipid acyltransferase (LPLAT)-like uncharacterized protein
MPGIKIRNPWLLKAASFVGTAVARLWMGTLEFRIRHLGRDTVNPHHVGNGERFIYALWHENMLLPAFQFARSDIHVLISQHADAQLFAELLRFLRVPLIRGSTNRGGIEAVRHILRRPGHKHLTITPDGPRGPRRQLQPGLPYLAARTGMPIVPIGFGYDRPWRLRSWDRFAIPRPWTLGTCVTAPPVAVPECANRNQLEDYRRLVEGQMNWVSAIAERWAETNRWPTDLAASPSALEEHRRAG